MPKNLKTKKTITKKYKRKKSITKKYKRKKTITKKYKRKLKGGSSLDNSNLMNLIKTLLPHITEEQINFIDNFLQEENNTKMHKFIEKIDLKKFEFSHLNDINPTKNKITKSQFDEQKNFFTEPEIINTLKEISVGEFIQPMSKQNSAGEFIQTMSKQNSAGEFIQTNSNQNARSTKFTSNHIKPLPSPILVGGTNQAIMAMPVITIIFFVGSILYYKNQQSAEEIASRSPIKCFYDNDISNYPSSEGEVKADIKFFLVHSTPPDNFEVDTYNNKFKSLIQQEEDGEFLKNIYNVYMRSLKWGPVFGEPLTDAPHGDGMKIGGRHLLRRGGVAYDVKVQETKVVWSSDPKIDSEIGDKTYARGTERREIDDALTRGYNRYAHFFEHVEAMAQERNVTHFIFDWDRTLQVMERMFGFYDNYDKRDYLKKLVPGIKPDLTAEPGMMIILLHYKWLYKNAKIDKKKLGEGLAKFHAGGSERMEKLKHMFKVIKDNDIPVTIMSANRAIITVPDIYITILKEWGCESATLYHAEPGKKYSQIHKIGKLV